MKTPAARQKAIRALNIFSILGVQVSVAALLVSGYNADCWADTPTAGALPTSNGAFQGVAGGGVTANINSCFSDVSSALSGAGGSSNNPISAAITSATTKGKGVKGASTSGCGPDTVPDSKSLSCDSASIQNPDGSFSPQKLQQEIATLSDLDGLPPTDAGAKKTGNPSLSCELTQFNNITSEMKCVQQQGQLLTQQIGSLANVYQQNITQFQQGQQAFTQREGDRQTQLTTIGQLLGGNKDSGTKGLLGEQSDLQKLVNSTMPQDIAAAQAQAKTVANERAVITENIQKHTMSLAGDCFQNQAKAGFQCTPGGPDLSPEAYVACMYGKYSHVQGGVYITGAAADQNAQAAQNSLQGILTQMYNQTSLSWVAPTDATSAATAGSRPDYGNSINDLVSNYVSQMMGMTVNGISVGTFVTQQLQACYASAQAEVATEQADPSSTVGQAEFQQTQTETALKATFDQKLETYTEKWTEAMGVLTTQNLPLNLSNCKSQDVTYEGNCLTDVQNQITGLLNGNGASTPFTMQVPYQFPDTQIPASALQCQGINGCVLRLQAVQQSVTNAKQTLVTGQASYEQQARTSTQQSTSQMASILSMQSSNLRTQLANINSSLQGLGVGTSISFPNVPSEKLQYDNTNSNGGQGIPKMPDSVLNLIGSQMNPPMMDLTDNSNNDASAMAEGVNKVKDKQAKVAALRSDWQSLFGQCGVQSVNAQFEANVANCSNACSNFTSFLSPSPTLVTVGGTTQPSTTLKTYSVQSGAAGAIALQFYASAQNSLAAAADISGGNSTPDPDADVGPETSDSASGGSYSINPSAKAKSTEINTELSAINNTLSGCASNWTANNTLASSNPNQSTGNSKVNCDALDNSGIGDDKGQAGTGHHRGGTDANSATSP